MDLRDSFRDFLYWEKASRDTIDFKKIYVDMTGDLLAGLLLSQIVFWHLPNKSGDSKLRVRKNGHYWIAKSHEEWYDEIRFSRYNFDTASKKLVQAGLIEKKVFKFNGTPMIHLRLIEEIFLKSWMDEIEKMKIEENENDDIETAPTLDLMEPNKSEKTAPTLDLMEPNKSICGNPSNENDGTQQMRMMEPNKSLTEITTEITTEIVDDDIVAIAHKIKEDKFKDLENERLKTVIARIKQNKANINDLGSYIITALQKEFETQQRASQKSILTNENKSNKTTTHKKRFKAKIEAVKNDDIETTELTPEELAEIQQMIKELDGVSV